MLVTLAACGHADLPATSAPPSAAATPTRDGFEVARSDDARSIHVSADPLKLSYREFERTGLWSVCDYSDTTLCLQRYDGKNDSVWLVPVRAGTPKVILPHAVSGRRFWISGVRVSDTWLAWEELGPGDDLVKDVPWRLYAAPLRSGLKLGRARLVAQASTGGARRPLFDLDGSRLVWTSATPTAPHRFDARAVERDLASRREKTQTRLLYHSDGDLQTVTLKDGVAVVMEIPDLPRPRARFAVLRLGSGERLAAIDVANEHPLSHWPAWRNGWLAWAPFALPEAQFPELYVRNPAGQVWLVGHQASDPVFVGGYLFYTDNRGSRPWVVDIRALRLQDMTSFSLVSGMPGYGDWWHGGGFGAPDVEHTFVASDERSYYQGDKEMYATLVRIYQVH